MASVLIVGASSGIGKSLASRLGADTDIWSVSRHADAETDHPHTDWDAIGDSPFPGDFLPERLDGLVYCPGSIRLQPVERFKLEQFRQDFELNLVGAVAALQAALPALRASPRASVVLFSTVAVATGMPMHASVAAAKGAVEGLARSLAAELAPGIRVNVIAPSLTTTPLSARLTRTEKQVSAAAQRHPMQRIGLAQDISALAEFLLSTDASWITGQVMGVDGGLGTLQGLN